MDGQMQDVLAGRALWAVVCGDARSVLAGMADASVDAVVTDPPYGQSNEAYDSGVPAGTWEQCYRVAKENAVLLSFAGAPTYHRVASAIERAGWHVRQMWAWVYRDGFMTSAWPREGFDRLAPAMDPICYATKGKVLLRVEREGTATWQRPRHTHHQAIDYSGRSRDHGVGTARGHWPRSIASDDDVPAFEYFMLSRTSGRLRAERVGHPNQKPVALMQWLVSRLPTGSAVLDPFCGSGSTGVACAAEGLLFVGIEAERSYVDIARARIAHAEQQSGPLFAGITAQR